MCIVLPRSWCKPGDTYNDGIKKVRLGRANLFLNPSKWLWCDRSINPRGLLHWRSSWFEAHVSKRFGDRSDDDKIVHFDLRRAMVVVMVMANRDYHSWINLERNSITVNGSAFNFDQIKRRKGDDELFRDRLHPAINSAKDRKVPIEDYWCTQLK